MIPSKLTRAAHRATAATPSPAGYACLSSRTHHHRRYSSSKASSADRDSAKAATAAAKPTVAAAKAQQSSTPSEASHASRSSKSKPRRDYRRLQTGLESKKNGQSDSPHDLRALPSAPSVQNLSETDRSLSNFFSLHRPMSINPSFPPTSTPEAFGKIFTTESSQDAWANGNSAERRPEDVIYTLHSTFETIESGAGQSQDDAVRYEIIHESPSNQSSQVHHLDGPPRLRSLEELVAQFKPFRAPPPPQPFPEYEGKQKGMDKRSGASGHAASRHANQPRQKTFTTTITVTESTHADGQKTYYASSSPIVALAEAEATLDGAQARPLTRRQRVQRLRQEGNVQAMTRGVPRIAPSALRGARMQRMHLISVKRQRKLKMKKHKYKKLMRRTRNLRRKLDRT